MKTFDPVPGYFTLRYVAWLVWSNAITILAVFQSIFISLILAAGAPDTLLSHRTVRLIVLANAILTGLIAELRKRTP